MTNYDRLVEAARAVLEHLDSDYFDPAFGGRTHKRREALRAALPAAKLYAERMGELEAALNGTVVPTLPRNVGTTWQDGYTAGAEAVRDHLRDLLASLDAPTDSGTATVGPDAEGGATSPDVIREAKCEAWEEGFYEGRGSARSLYVPRNPYAPPTATAKETNDES